MREDVLALCGFPFDINEIHRLARRDPAEFSAYWAERDRLDDEVEALVREGQAAGELRMVDPRLAARTLLASDEATQNWFRSEPSAGVTQEQLADHVAETALRSLLADPASFAAVRDEALAARAARHRLRHRLGAPPEEHGRHDDAVGQAVVHGVQQLRADPRGPLPRWRPPQRRRR